MRRILCWLTAGMMTLALAACHRSEQVNQEGASSETTSYSDETTLVSNGNSSYTEDHSWSTGSASRRRNEIPEQPNQPVERLVTIPAGTPLVVSLATELSTSRNNSGDSFSGTLSQPVVIDGQSVLPAGTTVSGTVSRVYAPKAGKAHMWLDLFQATLPSGTTYTLHTNTMELVAKPSTERDLEKVAAGGVAGGILGGIIGGGKGALIGAAVGAGAGTAVAVATRDKNVRLGAGQKLQFELTESMRVPPLA